MMRPIDTHGLATASACPMVTNMGSSISASDNSATSYDSSAPDDGAATVNSATIITASSAILIVGIAGTAIVPAANCNCPPSNHRSAAIDGSSPVNCGPSVNGSASVAAANGPDLHNLTVIQRSHEDVFGTGYGRADRLLRKKQYACDDPKKRLQCQVGKRSRLMMRFLNLPVQVAFE